MPGSTLSGSLDGPLANTGAAVHDVDALVSPSDLLNVVEDVSNNAGGVTDALPPHYAMDFAEPPKAYEVATFLELIVGIHSSSAATKTIYHFLVFLLQLLQLLPTLLCVALVALSRQLICDLVKNSSVPYRAQ